MALAVYEAGGNVTFISLASHVSYVGYYGKVSEHLSIFDLATRDQLEHSGIHFEDCLSMKEQYLREDASRDEDVKYWTLLEWYINRDKDADYFIDEFRLNHINNDEQLSVISSIMTTCNGHVWLALRKSYLLKQHTDKVEDCLRELHNNHNVCVAGLNVNMRSSALITNISQTESVQADSWDRRNNASAVDTVSSTPVHAMRVDKDEPHLFIKAIHHAFTLLGLTDPLQMNSPDAAVIIVDDLHVEFTNIVSCLPDNSNVISYSMIYGGDRQSVLRYLSQPSGVLVTDVNTMSGMEARNVVYMGSFGGWGRDALLRAVCNLVIISIGHTYYNDLIRDGCMDGGVIT